MERLIFSKKLFHILYFLFVNYQDINIFHIAYSIQNINFEKPYFEFLIE